MNKDIILVISFEMASSGGCYNLRIQQFVNYINQTNQFGVKCIVSPLPIFDPNVLSRCRGILVQRPFQPMPWLKNYRELQPKYKYKMGFEVDDAFWDILPDYNASSLQPRNFKAIDQIASENLKYFDVGIVTTKFLAEYLHRHHNFWNTVIVPNACDRAIYQSNRKDFFRDKPIVASAGASQHVLEPAPISQQYPAGIVGKRGDYVGQWPEFLRKNIDRMDLHYFVNAPYFLSDVSDKITVHTWKSTSMYSAELNMLKPDIIIAPLQNNDFNRAKSSLKFAEAAACGAILMGSVFPDSPYEMIHSMCKVPDNPTVEQLEMVFNNIRDHWKEILDYQYEFLNNNGWWLESSHHIATWINAITVPNEELI
jgi:hypothetical protein